MPETDDDDDEFSSDEAGKLLVLTHGNIVRASFKYIPRVPVSSDVIVCWLQAEMWNLDIVQREHDQTTLLLDDVTAGYLTITNHSEVSGRPAVFHE